MIADPDPVPDAAAAAPRLKFTGILFAPFARLVILVKPPATDVKDKLYGVPALHVMMTVELAVSALVIVGRLPKFIGVAEMTQDLAIVICTLNVPKLVAAFAAVANPSDTRPVPI